MDTFNDQNKVGFENKAVGKVSLDASDCDVSMSSTSSLCSGGRLYFPDFGLYSYCRPNIDIEYHVLGHTWHGASKPRFFQQGRGGGNCNEYCFAICDHPKKARTDREQRARNRGKFKRKHNL